MTFRLAAAAGGLLLWPLAALAHGPPPAPAHGGLIVEDSAEHWVELVSAGDQLTVYVLDEARRPVPSAQLGGKATVLVAGKSQVLALTPGDGNSLGGRLAASPAGPITAVLSLIVSGKPAQARFAPH